MNKILKSSTFRWIGGTALAVALLLTAYIIGQQSSPEPVNSVGVSEDIALPPNQSRSQQVRQWELQAQYTGPLQNTVVQRWRDPDNGATCYVYLPVIVQHSKPLDNGLVYYGANAIGSISCLMGR
jgi:hypothetical protein